MKVLFIGGTGNISSACARLAVERGIDLCLFNRGLSARSAFHGAENIRGDIRDLARARETLRSRVFDVVVDWVAYEPADIEADIELFRGRTGQFVFISSAAAYQKPPSHHVMTESTPLGNPFWKYASDKIACERRLLEAFEDTGFPVTIVRPSLTYGETWIPCAVGGHDYTVVSRMLRGKKVIVHGDGQSLWTVTHNTDFALGFLGLLGNEAAIGESFHITSDEVLTWDRIYQTIGAAAGTQPDLIHVPSEFISAFDSRMGASLLGDKAYSVIFDNSKIKRFVPDFRATVSFAEGMRRSIAWFDAEPNRKMIDEGRDRLMDRIAESLLSALPRN
ncbi:MAG: SDR family oxidoreductase [Acidobacteria bacterium]|nr:SDR family oxidoreductase [Acidobacteriota bacterium]